MCCCCCQDDGEDDWRPRPVVWPSDNLTRQTPPPLPATPPPFFVFFTIIIILFYFFWKKKELVYIVNVSVLFHCSRILSSQWLVGRCVVSWLGDTPLFPPTVCPHFPKKRSKQSPARHVILVQILTAAAVSMQDMTISVLLNLHRGQHRGLGKVEFSLFFSFSFPYCSNGIQFTAPAYSSPLL